jgi:YfdX protein
MTTTGAIILRVIGVAVGLFLAVPGSALLAHADARITADTKVERLGPPLTDEEMRTISFSAGRILKHVDQARQAIAKKDKSTAITQIDKGLTLAKIIEQSIPPTTVKSTIKAGTLEYWDEDKVKSLTVPIYQELDTISILKPVVAAKKKAAKADTAAKNTSATEQVEEVAESYTGITLNVADAKAHLETAKAALTEGHLDMASKDLATIQEEVTVVYAGERGPLAHAREDLALTQIYMDQGLRKQAQLALTDASASLSRYEKSSGTHQADVKTLQAEIAALSKELDQSTEGPLEKVKTKIMGWWDRVKSWESRHFSGTESPTTGLS